MEEIIIKGNNGTICFDTNSKSDKLRVTAVDDKGHADSHYVFNQEAISNCSHLTYIEKEDAQGFIPMKMKFIHANTITLYLLNSKR